MKKVMVILVLTMSFILAGCWDKESKEIGGGTNDNKSSLFTKNISEADMDDAYGPVIHHAVIGKSLIIQGVDMGASISAVNIIDKSSNPSLLSIACDSRAGAWAVTHTYTDVNGQPATQGTDFAIMNYREGLTNIREVDERGVVFSTADGDTNIVKGLKKLTSLDPKSTVAFVIDRQDQNGEAVGYAWSPLFKVEDVIDGLKKIDLSNCARATSETTEPPEIIYHSIQELRELATKVRQ